MSPPDRFLSVIVVVILSTVHAAIAAANVKTPPSLMISHALRNNTHLWRLDLRFNADFTDLACGCGKARDCAATGSLERELAQTCVRKPSRFYLQLSSATSSIGHRRARTRPHKLVDADVLQVLRVELVAAVLHSVACAESALL